ncbi:MAG: FAD binding domain-containing protein [Spirochaetaceae bacterium]|nr:FAD binding domain-containing protein [Spirochaetaceae bacterium]
MRISEIFYPNSLGDLLELLKANPELLIVAGGTEVVGMQASKSLSFPAQIASISHLPELQKTTRSEQYLEVGCCTTLSGLLTLSSGALPAPLPQVIQSIGNPAIRNTATIGGNLCCKRRFMDLWPFLACIDAQMEIRSLHGNRWAGVSHLSDDAGLPQFPEASILTRIRIPLHAPNFSFFKKLGNSRFPSPESAYFVCMAEISHDKIESFRLIFAGERAFRLKDHEATLIGRRVPLSQKDIQPIVDYYSAEFVEKTGNDNYQFNALTEESLGRISGQ